MAEPLKILHLRSSGGMYGAESVIINLCRELNARGCHNHILCMDNTTNPHTELVDAALGLAVSSSSVECRGLIDRHAIAEIRAALVNGNFTILHTHDYKATVYGLLASRGLGIRRVATNHLWDTINTKLWLYQRLEGVCYNAFDRIIAVSSPVAESVRPFLLTSSKLVMIPNGIDPHHFKKQSAPMDGVTDPGVVTIGIVGRLAAQKGHCYLFDALAIIKKNFSSDLTSPLRVLVVGDGPLKAELKDQCQTLGLAVHDMTEGPDAAEGEGITVIFTGVQRDMPRVYHSLDVFVMPSLSEGMPMALLEAMSAGVPVVATAVGDIPRAVRDGSTGRLVRPGQAQELADALVGMIRHPKVRRELAAAGQTLVDTSFSARAMGEKYWELYKKMI